MIGDILEIYIIYISKGSFENWVVLDMFINMRQACGHWKIGKNTSTVTK